jgi:hypothetical protein
LNSSLVNVGRMPMLVDVDAKVDASTTLPARRALVGSA